MTFTTFAQDRIIMLTGPVEDNMANSIIAQLFVLGCSRRCKDICMLAPGGSVSQLVLPLLTVDFIKSDVPNHRYGDDGSIYGTIIASEAVPKVNVSCCQMQST